MKYLRKMVALLIGVAFFAALIICVGRIFAVKNININVITYEEDSSESYGKAKEALSVYKGESLLFLSEDDIAKAVAGSNYVIASCEKKYPCTINVTIKERLEVFAVSVGDLYSMYDGDGEFLRRSRENTNDIDETPNVELTGIAIEQVQTIAKIATVFKTNFGGLRSIVNSIELDSNPDIEGYIDKLRFNLRCGLVIQINDYMQDYEEKISVVYKKFNSLSDRQKLSGKVIGVGNDDGFIYADYLPL
ncbi:MAG: hypothetical protein K2N23_02335 [Clostridia bacterium]|nr:hypothetical protein [Clostridia bacterium]